MQDLQDRIVIVTGAGTGIGRGVARAFVREGARVALVGRTLATLEETAEGLPPDQVMIHVADVADREAVNAMAAAVTERFGPVDVLVNNAGTNFSPRGVSTIDPSHWDTTVNVNLTGVFNCCRAVLPGVPYPGGHPMGRPPSRWQCRWNTVWPPS